MRVAGIAASSLNSSRRWAERAARNPAKKKRSGGRPDKTRAASAAEGPGTAVTGRSSAIAACTSL